jgi:uncharacterized protein YciI
MQVTQAGVRVSMAWMPAHPGAGFTARERAELYALKYEDDEAFADQRARHKQAHLAFLERHAERIRAAGPLVDAGDGTPAGGLWLVEAQDRQEVDGLIEADPFRNTGLRRSIRVLVWRQVFAEGRRLR